MRTRRRLYGIVVLGLLAASVAIVATAPSVVASVQTYGDDFATYDYGGSTGTHAWAFDWFDDEADGPGAGAARVRDEPHCATDPCLVIGRGGPDDVVVERGVDLSGATAATISFTSKVHVHLGGNGEVRFEASSDGGGNWDTLAVFPLTADTGLIPETIDLTDYTTSNARIRFELLNGSDDSHLNVDDLTITATFDPPAPVVVSEFSHRNDSFFELYNAGVTPVDIDDYLVRLSDGVTNVTIDQGGGPVILAPGAHYLVAQAGSGLAAVADQTMPDGLTGDTGIRVFDTFGRLLDTVGLGGTARFEGSASLPPMPGGGIPQSYERLNTGGLGNCIDTNDNRADFVHNFGFSNPQGLADPPVPCGTPVAASHVVISEFRPEGPNGNEDEFVEIFNPTGAPVDISGWKFHITEPGLYRDYHVVPAGVILQPGDYYLLSDDDGPVPNNAHPYDVPTDYSWWWGDVVLKDASDAIVDVFGYGDVGNGQMYEGTAQLSYEGAGADRSYARRHGGMTDTDDNMADFVYAFDATPAWTNLAPVFGQDLGDRADPEGAFISIDSGADDPNGGTTLTYSATGLPEGVQIDEATGEIQGVLGPDAAGVHSVTVTVSDDGAPVLQATDDFTWTVTGAEVHYLIAGVGGSDGGDDLLTAVDPTDNNPATNEFDVGAGTGTWNVEGASIRFETGQLYGANGSQLGVIDLTTGRFGATGSSFGTGDGVDGTVTFDDVHAIAFHPVTGELYAAHKRLSDDSVLFKVDPVTGARVAGAFAGDDYVVIPRPGAGLRDVEAMAIEPTTGTLYGVFTDQAFLWRFASVDTETGATSSIGSTSPGIRGLSFDSTGQLWGVGYTGFGTLSRINTNNGTASQARVIDNGAFYAAAAFSAPPVTNRPPVFDEDLGDRSDPEGAVVSFASSATDPDIGHTLTYTATGLPTGISIDPGSGLISGTIDALAAAGSPYGVTITVTDDGAPTGQAVDTFEWTVTDVNRPPVLDPIVDPSGDEETLITFTATGSDPDFDGLSFSLAGEPPGASIDPVSGIFTWTPLETQDGAVSFEVVVTDDGVPAVSDSQTITVTVVETNRAPVLIDPGPQIHGEGDTISLTIVATDADDPANAIVFGAAGLPPGLSIDGASGEISGTVDPLAAGGSPYSATITATDDGVPSLQDVVVVAWTITDTNRSPIIDPIVDPAGDEETLITFTATGSDPDFDGLSFSLAGEPPGASIDPVSGIVTWTPTESQDGSHAFDVVLTDDGTPVLSNSWRVTVLVGEVNVAPVLDPIAGPSGDEETLLTFTATATDADLPANGLSFSLNGAPAGASIDPASGVFSWTPSEAQDGTHVFDVVVVDDGAPSLADSRNVTITVNETNKAPALSPISDRSDAEGDSILWTLTANDADAPVNALTYSANGLPPGLSIEATSGIVSGTIDALAAADSPYAVTVTVTDDGIPVEQDSRSFTWTVTDVNRPPVLDPVTNPVGDEQTLISATITASDPDLDGLTYSLAGAPAGATIDPASGLLTWTPGETQDGIHVFDVVVADDGIPSLTDTKTITVVVAEANRAPVLSHIADRTNAEGDSVLWTVAADDPDVPANSLTFDAGGLPPGLSIAPDTGIVSGSVGAVARAGSPYTVTISVVDDGSPPGRHEKTFTWTVTDTNRRPKLGAIEEQTTYETVEVSFTAVATDPDGDLVSYSLDGAPRGAVIDPTNGRFSWTPDELHDGVHTFDVVATDDAALSLEDRRRVKVTVLDKNVAPDLEIPADRIDPEGAVISLAVPASDPDVPADTLTWSTTDLPPGLTMDSATGVISGTISYEAATGSPYTVTVTVIDGRGGKCEHSFTWTITDTNRPPLVEPVAITVDPGTVVSFVASAIDPDGDAFDFSLADQPPTGAAIDPATGSFEWATSTDSVVGTYTFSIQATDDRGAVGSARAAITVANANQPPSADSQDVSVREDESVQITLTAADSDGDALAFEITRDPTRGAVAGESPIITYRPNPDVNGSDRIEFRVTDPDGAQATAVISITIVPVNDAPRAGADRYETPWDETLTVAAPGILANDVDIDGDVLTAIVVDEPAHGGVIVDPDGGFTYTADPGYVGEVTFTYEVRDGSGGIATASVTLDVTGIPAVSSPERNVAVDAIVSYESEATASSPAPDIEEDTAPTIRRTLVLMSRSTGIAVQQMGIPFVLFLLAAAAVVALGRLRVIPLFGRRTSGVGTVSVYSAENGFGLVIPDGETQELFVHRSALRMRDRDRLRGGDRVRFRVVAGEHRDIVTRLRRF